jgi:spermidine/putrescine transport system ATP-binding protein
VNPLAVELLQVSKSYKSYQALYDLSLGIERGEFFSLLGPSGCGKTTTLRLIAGFEEPTAGQVKIDGQSVAGLPAYRRNVNTVFQSYSLFPHMSIFENVAFGLRRRGMAKAEVKQKVGKSLEMVHLSDKIGGRIQQLSGGQQQRVALARALVNEPAVLLLDEPMAALDSKLRKDMRSELKRLQKSLGITFVLVTHDQEEALTMSDRLAVMQAGRLEQVCQPREIYDSPATRFVAEFIGHSNFLPVKVQQICNGRTQVEGQAGNFWVRTHASLVAGDAAEVSLRPERLEISLSQPQEGSNVLTGTVTEIVFMGAVTRYRIALHHGQEVFSEQQSGEGLEPVAGQSVYLSWQAEAGSLVPHR